MKTTEAILIGTLALTNAPDETELQTVKNCVEKFGIRIGHTTRLTIDDGTAIDVIGSLDRENRIIALAISDKENGGFIMDINLDGISDPPNENFSTYLRRTEESCKEAGTMENTTLRDSRATAIATISGEGVITENNCTGSFIDRNGEVWLLTAGHCIEGKDSITVQWPVLTPDGEIEYFWQIEIPSESFDVSYQASTYEDCATTKLSSTLPINPLKTSEGLHEDEPTDIIGHPLGMSYMSYRTTNANSLSENGIPINRLGLIFPPETFLRNGISGAPLLQGETVAGVVFGHSYSNDRTNQMLVATPISEIEFDDTMEPSTPTLQKCTPSLESATIANGHYIGKFTGSKCETTNTR